MQSKAITIIHPAVTIHNIAIEDVKRASDIPALHIEKFDKNTGLKCNYFFTFKINSLEELNKFDMHKLCSLFADDIASAIETSAARNDITIEFEREMSKEKQEALKEAREANNQCMAQGAPNAFQAQQDRVMRNGAFGQPRLRDRTELELLAEDISHAINHERPHLMPLGRGFHIGVHHTEAENGELTYLTNVALPIDTKLMIALNEGHKNFPPIDCLQATINGVTYNVMKTHSFGSYANVGHFYSIEQFDRKQLGELIRANLKLLAPYLNPGNKPVVLTLAGQEAPVAKVRKTRTKATSTF